MIKAAKGVTHQVCRSLSMRKCDTILRNRVLPQASAHIKELYRNFTGQNIKKSVKINSVRYFGASKKAEERWVEELHLTVETVSYKRMIKDKCIFTGLKNKKERSDNSFAKLKDGSIMNIQQFLVDKFSQAEYTIYRPLTTVNAFQDQCRVLQKVTAYNNDLRVANTNDIEKICVFLKINDAEYICPVPNMHYF